MTTTAARPVQLVCPNDQECPGYDEDGEMIGGRVLTTAIRYSWFSDEGTACPKCGAEGIPEEDELTIGDPWRRVGRS